MSARHMTEAERKHADELVRYCPECGTIGPVKPPALTCCPDSCGMSLPRWQAEKMERMLNRLRSLIPQPVPAAGIVPPPAKEFLEQKNEHRDGDERYEDGRDHCRHEMLRRLAARPSATQPGGERKEQGNG